MSNAGIRNLTLFFCQDAESGSDGRLHAVGIYSELYSRGFPAKQDRLVLAGIIEWERHVEGEQPFTIHLADPDGKPIFTIEGRTVVDARPEERAPARSHLIFPMESLVFMRPGEYPLILQVGGEEMAGPVLYLMNASGAD